MYLMRNNGDLSRHHLSSQLVSTVGDKIHKLQQNNEENCNHADAGTRLVLLALQDQTDAIIVVKDTDVLVLLAWLYNKYHVRHKWYFKYDAEIYADVGAICDFLEEDVCLALLTFHAITGRPGGVKMKVEGLNHIFHIRIPLMIEKIHYLAKKWRGCDTTSYF